MTDAAAGLYLHVPFCARICPYCDFAVRTGDRARRARYVDHLVAETGLQAGWSATLDTVYLGGGTPSLLDPEELGRALQAVRARLAVDPRARLYLEANPEDVTSARLADWRGLGVETLSLGLQSLDAAGLELLGRRHDVAQARRAVELALGAGFATVSIDLIYGRPGQSADAWRRELELAADLAPQHITCYQLTVHERTRFGLLERRGRLAQLPRDEQAALFRLTHRHLEQLGYAGYEVSQFAAAPEHRSRHNLKYWNHTPYLGLGPAAHSFDGRRRWWNLRRTDDWQARVARGEPPVEGQETLDDRALALEALMLGLRTHDGVDLERLRSQLGVDLPATNAALLERLAAEGLVRLEPARLVPTLDGLAVADALAAAFEI